MPIRLPASPLGVTRRATTAPLPAPGSRNTIHSRRARITST